jgi:hypothetical protein
VTFPDRFASGLVSAIAAIGTAIVVGLGLLSNGADPTWAPFYYGTASIALLAFIVGFVVGPVRAAEYLGVIWGTNDVESHRGFTAVMILAVIGICAWILLQ